MNPSTEAAHLSVLEPNTDPTSCEDGVIGPSDLSPATRSEPRASVPIESDWAPVMEFTAADIFQHLPLGDVLKLIKVSFLVGRFLAELCPARVGSGRRRSLFPTHHPLNSHCR